MKYLITVLAGLALQFSIAQVEQVKRIEIEDATDVYQFGDKGVVVLDREFERGSDYTEWVLTFYDTDLNESSRETIHLDKKMLFDEDYKSEDHLYLFFTTKKKEYVVIKVNPENNSFEEIKGRIPPKCYVSDMVAVDNIAYFRGYIKRKHYMFTINLETGQQNPIPISIEGIDTKKGKITDLQVLDEEDEAIVYLSKYQKRLADDKIAAIYDVSGDKKEIINLSQNEENELLNVSASPLKGDGYIWSGTYGIGRSKISNGIFFGASSEGKMDFVNYFPYSDLTEFLKFLPEKKQAKIEKKKAKKKARGKEFKISYRMAAHDIIKKEDGYILIGEAYYPTYRTETYTTTSVVNGVSTTTTQTRQVFDGYRYTHAIVIKFDLEGNMVWDRYFELNPQGKPFYVKRYISVNTEDDGLIKLLYATGGQICGKSYDYDGVIVNEFKRNTLELSEDAEVARWTNGDVDYWYDNFFFTYGWQRIKNKEKELGKRKRTIYYLSKIKFEE